MKLMVESSPWLARVHGRNDSRQCGLEHSLTQALYARQMVVKVMEELLGINAEALARVHAKRKSRS
jgi:hypothetical protein